MPKSKANKRVKVVVTYNDGEVYEQPCWNSTVAMTIEHAHMQAINVVATRTEEISDKEYLKLLKNSKFYKQMQGKQNVIT